MASARRYDVTSTRSWVLSHVRHYRRFVVAVFCFSLLGNATYSGLAADGANRGADAEASGWRVDSSLPGLARVARGERAEVERAALDASAYELITALPGRYDTIIGQRGVTLSGGQRQRIALARAFAPVELGPLCRALRHVCSPPVARAHRTRRSRARVGFGRTEGVSPRARSARRSFGRRLWTKPVV